MWVASIISFVFLFIKQTLQTCCNFCKLGAGNISSRNAVHIEVTKMELCFISLQPIQTGFLVVSMQLSSVRGPLKSLDQGFWKQNEQNSRLDVWSNSGGLFSPAGTQLLSITSAGYLCQVEATASTSRQYLSSHPVKLFAFFPHHTFLSSSTKRINLLNSVASSASQSYFG